MMRVTVAHPSGRVFEADLEFDLVKGRFVDYGNDARNELAVHDKGTTIWLDGARAGYVINMNDSGNEFSAVSLKN
jgi:hypothetical protein